MRTITLEEHYATEAFMEGPGRELKEQAEAARSHPQVAAGYTKLIDELCDLGGGRISALDAAGIDVQVLSLTFPGVEQLEAAEAVAFARETNDLLAEAVRRHPDRFAGFAALPTASPEAGFSLGASSRIRVTASSRFSSFMPISLRAVGARMLLARSYSPAAASSAPRAQATLCITSGIAPSLKATAWGRITVCVSAWGRS